MPEEECLELAEASAVVSYGWGMIQVIAQIGGTRWRTSLFPKDGRYIVPLKAAVRRSEALKVGDVVMVRLAVDVWPIGGPREGEAVGMPSRFWRTSVAR